MQLQHMRKSLAVYYVVPLHCIYILWNLQQYFLLSFPNPSLFAYLDLCLFCQYFNVLFSNFNINLSQSLHHFKGEESFPPDVR